MTNIVSSLLWQDQSDVSAPLAPYNVDFSVDVNWSFNNLQSTYLNNAIYPAGVVVDNSQGASAITVSYGSYKAVVNAYTAAAISLQGTNLIVSMQGSAPNKVPVYFYIKEPSPGTLGINYQKAAVPVVQQFASAYATVAAGVVTIKKSTNITSIVRNSIGSFTVTMTNGAADTNYRISLACGFNAQNRWHAIDDTLPKTVNTFSFYGAGDNIGVQDPTSIYIDVWS